MIIKGKTSNWPQDALSIVYRNLNHLPICVYIGQSVNSECSISTDKFFEYDLVLIFSSIVRRFIVWNVKMHEGLHAGSTVKLSMSNSKVSKSPDNEIKTYPRPLSGTNGAEARNENVTVIPEQRLYDYLSSIETYLLKSSNPNDCKHTQSLEVLRMVDRIMRSRRDPEFRVKVRNRYHHMCVVCGEKEEKALEAAHIIAVKDGGNDDAENGVCLCANHHLMYDAGIIEIDIGQKRCSFCDGFSSDASWYTEAEERNFELII